ncbi:histidyl-tRNA synthetase [Thermaerobacter marianensis DSM 12885]|uniref:Histidine--tRNA ligase n=1 Tax=Thermaerobacter marianensis (strain ATCC 700841 / DSM 12885 / JCM 10246 / 7p75a) TaxID=644966 RepID=E6SLC3_THEM7|nr:histidine--tRNA ligase [Thermaerobacter marianensis]ADU51354.1 histidyl-tRNA synthetase [Thermaerobacter marianensis DSM 12885]
MERIQRPRGTYDVTPQEAPRWQALEARIRDVAARFGFGELRTPVIEARELFQRTVGETTDIVQKEMYVLTPPGSDRQLVLRPEGTAAAVRAYLENGLHNGPQPVKLFYIQPMFRHERPQAGRYRQHVQFGVEIFGAGEATADAEIIALAVTLFAELGLEGLEVHLNSIGCPVCRPRYRQALLEYYRPRAAELCSDCRARLETNPLRLLDCKVPADQPHKAGAPRTVDYLCDACRDHFDQLQAALAALGIAYRLDSGLVRGLDYYTRTVFEIKYGGLGAQDTVCGGGRYDGLIELLGGPPTPGVGFGMGLERLLLTLEALGRVPGAARPLHAFVAVTGQVPRARVLALVQDLRRAGLAVDMDHVGRSLKAQLRAAARLPVRYAVILGDEEWAAGQATVRHLESGAQRRVALAELAAALREEAGSPAGEGGADGDGHGSGHGKGHGQGRAEVEAE